MRVRVIFDVSGGRNVDFFAKIWPCYMGIYPDKALPELFYDLFLARTGSRREGGGEVGTGPEPVPRLLICFGRRI